MTCEHSNATYQIVIERWIDARILTSEICDNVLISRDTPQRIRVFVICPDCGLSRAYCAYNPTIYAEIFNTVPHSVDKWPAWLLNRLIPLRAANPAVQEACLAGNVPPITTPVGIERLMPNLTYSNLLHDSAARWGLPVPEDRPIIDDATSSYPRPVVVETLEWHSGHGWPRAAISLVTLHDLWSFAYSVSFTGAGGGFAPFLKFCDPLPTRDAALAAAIRALRERHALPAEITAWLDSLQPQQLSLFERQT